VEGLAVYTSGLFWVTISISRKYWHSPSFCLVIAGLLLVRLVAFVAILRSYHQWRMIWFMPVVIVEGGLFGDDSVPPVGERQTFIAANKENTHIII
jgi:apolipoprotein N-acyltransferase